MAAGPSTSDAGRVVDASVNDAKAELKRSVQQLLIRNLKQRSNSVEDGRRHQLARVNSASIARTQSNGRMKDVLSSNSQVARYLRDRGYEYTLSVMMAEANVPDTNVLKSIAARLNDTRSKLVVGNPDFQAAIVQIWDEIEKKYNEKLRQYVIDWEMKQTMHLQQMEGMLRRNVAEEEQEMRRQISLRVAEMEAKEKELVHVLRDRTAAYEHQAESEKLQLLEEAKELDGKRHNLLSLESEFQRQVEIEQNRIRSVKENLNQLSAELKRQQLQLTFQMDEGVKEARRQEQLRYTEKLQQLGKKEEKIREIVEKAKANRGQADALKFMVNERDGKIQDLEMALQQYKIELVKLQEKLREKEDALHRMGDYELLKFENSRMREESRTLRDTASKEKLQLQKRNHELEADVRELTSRISEWTPHDENLFKKELDRVHADFEKSTVEWRVNEAHYQKQLEAEKARNEQLKSRLDEQSMRLQALLEEMKKLQFQVAKRRVLNETSNYGERVSMRQEFDEIEDADEEEPTPDYLKEAKRRLRLLERETETFEESVRRYQQKSIDSSTLALWKAQAASSAYVSNPRNFNVGTEIVRSNIVHWSDDRQSATPTSIMEQPSRPAVLTKQSEPITMERQPIVNPVQPVVAVDPKPTTLHLSNVEDDWETKLRKREEERRRRDEEFRKQQEEELRRLQQTEQKAPMVNAAMPLPSMHEPSTSVAPGIDPVLQKYMQMVLEQRQKEKEAPRTSSVPESESGPSNQAASVSIPTKEIEVEVASIKEASSESDFEW